LRAERRAEISLHTLRRVVGLIMVCRLTGQGESSADLTDQEWAAVADHLAPMALDEHVSPMAFDGHVGEASSFRRGIERVIKPLSPHRPCQ